MIKEPPPFWWGFLLHVLFRFLRQEQLHDLSVKLFRRFTEPLRQQLGHILAGDHEPHIHDAAHVVIQRKLQRVGAVAALFPGGLDLIFAAQFPVPALVL